MIKVDYEQKNVLGSEGDGISYCPNLLFAIHPHGRRRTRLGQSRQASETTDAVRHLRERRARGTFSLTSNRLS